MRSRQAAASCVKSVDGPHVHDSIYWSRLHLVDKYHIRTTVPSVAGLYELYFKDDRGRLVLFRVAKTWFSGVRNALREATDIDLIEDKTLSAILDERSCLYRYCEMGSEPDMDDVVYFLEQTYLPGSREWRHSGRYDRIYLDEHSDDKVVMV